MEPEIIIDVIRLYNQGRRTREIATHHHITRSTVQHLIKNYNKGLDDGQKDSKKMR